MQYKSTWCTPLVILPQKVLTTPRPPPRPPPPRILAKILATLPGFSTVWIYGVLVLVCRSREWMVNFVQFIFRNLYRGKYYIIPIILIKLKKITVAAMKDWTEKTKFLVICKTNQITVQAACYQLLILNRFYWFCNTKTNTVNTNKIIVIWLMYPSIFFPKW
jgi:hypothetical protein